MDIMVSLILINDAISIISQWGSADEIATGKEFIES